MHNFFSLIFDLTPTWRWLVLGGWVVWNRNRRPTVIDTGQAPIHYVPVG
jgi:hypothetical protein